MSSVFVPDNNNHGSPQKQPEQARPKRPRSSLACIRCRKKKVKCDFVQPTCGRCAIAGLPCSYATPPRRVDGHAFDQLGNHVEELKERMQKMQSELAMMKNNLHPFASSSTTTNDDIVVDPNAMMMSDNNMALATSHHNTEQSVTWKLSLSPSGLRIDTNIASVADLYRILLNGISQLNINNEPTTSLFNPESSSASTGTPLQGQKKQPTPSQPKSTMKRNFGSGNYLDNTMMDYNNDKGGRLWEVDDNEARKILQEKKSAEDTLPKNVLDNLMHTCYHTCFLAYQIVDKDAFMQQYMSKEGLEPLLANSIHAWVSKHGCIYHHANNGHSATTMGEFYFKEARQSLKRCFDISSPTTIHALLNLYMYQLSSERSSLAYLYIGLAIRMAQDLKFHKKEHMSADLNQRETNKRLWWSAYWLDLCAALESNRPTMVDDKDCDLDYPVRLEHEDDETGYRVHFAVYSIKLMRIRKDITKHLPSEQSGQSLLSAISRLENALTNWLSELPNDLHFDDQASVFQKTGSFRDEACLILNIQYQTTWIMLHKFFLPKQDQTATPVALLSLNICTKAANLITRMLSIYAANLNWCQFFYAMDGIIASVTIHQVNAQSSEKEVSCLAQRNLIMTANVLKESPLMYMVRVCEIIESIEGFLKKNGLSSNLHDLPPVSEDSINQQSISSVFHPAVFDSQANVMPQPTNASYTGSLSPSVHSQHTMMNSPQSQHSNHMRVPSQLTPMFQSSSTQQQSSPAASSASTATHTTTTTNTTTAAAAGQQLPKPPVNMYNDPNIMVDSNLFLNDPTLMGFNMAAPSQPNTGDMNQLLLRDMGFDLNNERMYNMFTPRNTTNTTSHSFPNNAPYSQFNNNFNSFENTSATPPPATTTTTTTSATSSYPHFLNHPNDLFGLQQQPPTATSPQPPQPPPPSSQPPSQPFMGNTPFDPSLFGSMNMDPATMSALLYNNGMPNFNAYPSGNNPGDENDLLYANNGRKRAHRDWEDTA